MPRELTWVNITKLRIFSDKQHTHPLILEEYFIKKYSSVLKSHDDCSNQATDADDDDDGDGDDCGGGDGDDDGYDDGGDDFDAGDD